MEIDLVFSTIQPVSHIYPLDEWSSDFLKYCESRKDCTTFAKNVKDLILHFSCSEKDRKNILKKFNIIDLPLAEKNKYVKAYKREIEKIISGE